MGLGMQGAAPLARATLSCCHAFNRHNPIVPHDPMPIPILDIPDKPAELATWIEQQLVGLHLGRVIAELTIVHEPEPTSRPGLEHLLGPHQTNVLSDGLKVLPAETLGTLLTHPELLSELQQLVLSSGSEYWENLQAKNPEVAAWVRSHPLTFGPEGPVISRGQPSGSEAVERRGDLQPHQRRRGLWTVAAASAITAVAAAALIAVWLGRAEVEAPQQPDGPAVAEKPAPWGWNKPDAFAGQDRQEILQHLEDGAAEWSNKTPTNADQLSRRLTAFRKGCKRLEEAELPLSDQERGWLRSRCRGWGATAESLIADLEQGRPLSEVQGDADKLMMDIRKALQVRREDTPT